VELELHVHLGDGTRLVVLDVVAERGGPLRQQDEVELRALGAGLRLVPALGVDEQRLLQSLSSRHFP